MNNTNDKSGWISVETELPDYDVYVLWVNEHGNMWVAEIDHDCDWETFSRLYGQDSFSNESIKITHWMYLPQPPQTKNS